MPILSANRIGGVRKDISTYIGSIHLWSGCFSYIKYITMNKKFQVENKDLIKVRKGKYFYVDKIAYRVLK